MVDPKIRREKYIELKRKFPNRIMFKYLEPLFDEIFDELPEEFPEGELFYIRSTKQTGFRCKCCGKVRLIGYKHAGRDIWNPILEGKNNICSHCNRTEWCKKGFNKIQYLLNGDSEECLEYQKKHLEQWLAASKTGSNTIKRYFDPNDEFYNTENAIKARELFDKNRGSKYSYSYDRIIQKIEESEFKNRKDVKILLSRIKSLKNYDDSLDNLLIQKAKSLGIPTTYREEIYSKPLSLIYFNYQDKEVSLNDIDSYSKIPGVWSVWSENNCLDVYQTKDIGKEILLFIRRMDNLQNPNINTKNKSWNTKYTSMLENISDKFIVKIVATEITSINNREKIEFQYAHDNKALYWNPSSTQYKFL